MTSDHDNDGSKKSPQDKKILPDDTIENIKRKTIYGEHMAPPQHKRSKKGQPRNSKARPVSYDFGFGSSRAINTLALNEAGRLIGVREGTESREMAAIEAVIRKQYASALQGSAYAQKHIIERYGWAEREAREERLRSIEVWEAYIVEHQDAISRAKERREALPTPLPHPDDIVIDYEKGVQFKGPFNEDELARLESSIKIRDILIMQDALDRREAEYSNTDDPDQRPGTALLFAMALNQNIPKRFSLSDVEILLKMSRYDATPKRVLLKELYRAWREVGASARRGYTFPSLGVGKKFVSSIADCVAKHQERVETQV